MRNYHKVIDEYNAKLLALKKEINPTIYVQDLSMIILFEKLLELQEEIARLKAGKVTNNDTDEKHLLLGDRSD